VTFKNDNTIMGIRWLLGAHPDLGEIIHGKNGFETIQKFCKQDEIVNP
jgi:hypothetical protein